MSGTTLAILISILITLAIVGGVCLWYYVLRKPKKIETPQTPEVVELNAVLRLQGSNPFGYETDEEVSVRLNSIKDKRQFKALNVNERPYTHEQWQKLTDRTNSDELIEARNKLEMSLCFLYNVNGDKNEKTQSFLIREFK